MHKNLFEITNHQIANNKKGKGMSPNDKLNHRIGNWY